MRRKFTLLPAAAALSVPLFFGAVSIAQGDATTAAQGSMQPRRLEHLKTKLGLTDDQVATIRSTFQANRDARSDLRKQLKTASADLRTAALNGEDASTIQQKTDAVTALYGKMLALRSGELAKIGAVLTPDQRTKFAAMHEHHGGRHHGHWGHHQDAQTPAAEG